MALELEELGVGGRGTSLAAAGKRGRAPGFIIMAVGGGCVGGQVTGHCIHPGRGHVGRLVADDLGLGFLGGLPGRLLLRGGALHPTQRDGRGQSHWLLEFLWI